MLSGSIVLLFGYSKERIQLEVSSALQDHFRILRAYYYVYGWIYGWILRAYYYYYYELSDIYVYSMRHSKLFNFFVVTLARDLLTLSAHV